MAPSVNKTGMVARRSGELAVVLVMPANPHDWVIAFVTSLRDDIEVMVRNVQHVETARIGRVGVNDLAGCVFVEHTHPWAFGREGPLDGVVVDCLLCGELVRGERYSIVEVE